MSPTSSSTGCKTYDATYMPDQGNNPFNTGNPPDFSSISKLVGDDDDDDDDNNNSV